MNQVKVFDDYEDNAVEKLNEFISDKKVIDVKMNTVVAVTGDFFTRYLVIYEDNAFHNVGYNPHKR